MSTKTTFKRVALVAVAALGLGVLSVAPSSATPQGDTLTLSATSASTTVGTAATVTVTQSFLAESGDTMTVTASLDSFPAASSSQPAWSSITAVSTDAGTGISVDTATARVAKIGSVTGFAQKTLTLSLNPAKAGVYVVRLTPAILNPAAGAAVTQSKTWTVTVTEPVIQGPDATNSELYLMTDFDYNNNVEYVNGSAPYVTYSDLAGAQTYVNTADTKTITVVSPVGTLIGSALWVAKGATTSAVFKRTPVTVKVEGPALVSTQADYRNPYSAKNSGYTETNLVNVGVDPYSNSATSADASIFIYSTGVAGKVTITATMDGVVLGARSFSIIGDTKSYVFGTPTKSVVGVLESMTVAVTGADSLGTTTGAASVYAFSSDATIATVNTNQASTVVVTGVKSGTATITIGNASTLAASTITKTLAVKVGAITAKTVAFSMSPTAPQPGEKVTVTVTATDASGNPVGDGSRNLFTSAGITTSLAVQGATWTAAAAVTLVNGTAAYTFYAPTGTGTLEVSATEGASTDSTTKAAITGSVTIVNSAVDAATDAANEAYDAANAATDAALAAAEAADAATVAAQEASDAVAALSESVTKLIAGLQAQIKSLAAVVAKIAKKVKA